MCWASLWHFPLLVTSSPQKNLLTWTACCHFPPSYLLSFLRSPQDPYLGSGPGTHQVQLSSIPSPSQVLSPAPASGPTSLLTISRGCFARPLSGGPGTRVPNCLLEVTPGSPLHMRNAFKTCHPALRAIRRPPATIAASATAIRGAARAWELFWVPIFHFLLPAS